jgi:hypothetical protein
MTQEDHEHWADKYLTEEGRGLFKVTVTALFRETQG